MLPAIRNWTRDEMMKRVAFFRDLKGSKGGLPDSNLPECEREWVRSAEKPIASAAAIIIPFAT
jgi:hypothetical protein